MFFIYLFILQTAGSVKKIKIKKRTWKLTVFYNLLQLYSQHSDDVMHVPRQEVTTWHLITRRPMRIQEGKIVCSKEKGSSAS